MARHHSDLKVLSTQKNYIGWEGVAMVASNVKNLENISLEDNKDILMGISLLQRLPHLRILRASTSKLR